MTLLLTILALLGLAGYLFISGFHDAPNAVAVAVRTRALTSRFALSISAVLNAFGLLGGALFFAQFAHQWLVLPENNVGLAMLLTALIAQIFWGIITWWFRMPASSTYALMGGLLGSMWAARAVGISVPVPFRDSLITLVFGPFIVFPILVFLASWLAVFPFSRLVSLAYPRTVHRISRNVMSLSNSIISLVHGVQIGQRAFMIFLMIAVVAQFNTSAWTLAPVALISALILGLGTYMGSWRIGHTFAYKMVRLDPFRGAVAQGNTSIIMVLSQLLFDTPISSSHLAASSVLGAGINQKFSSVRPGIAVKLLLTWISTIPASFCISAILFLALSPLID